MILSKSMYSLILSDEVIERIDSMAKLRNLSRSGLIDQVLAQYTSVVTPEQQMKDLYELMHSHMLGLQNEFRSLLGQGGRDFTAISALRYKYNPTIRYNVVLYRDGSEHIGEIRATLRTQNAELLREYAGFIRLWSGIEEAVTGKSVKAQLGGGVYRRLISRPGDQISPEQMSKAITDYIALLNSSVKQYLSGKDDIQAAAGEITKQYISYCKGGILI